MEFKAVIYLGIVVCSLVSLASSLPKRSLSAKDDVRSLSNRLFKDSPEFSTEPKNKNDVPSFVAGRRYFEDPQDINTPKGEVPPFPVGRRHFEDPQDIDTPQGEVPPFPVGRRHFEGLKVLGSLEGDLEAYIKRISNDPQDINPPDGEVPPIPFGRRHSEDSNEERQKRSKGEVQPVQPVHGDRNQRSLLKRLTKNGHL